MENEKITVGNELLRFLITGLVCALADFLTCTLVLKFLGGLPSIWQTIISVSAGFIVGVIMNYLLSTYWVFKGSDDKKTKTPMFIFWFVLLSAIALALSIGSFELCRVIILNGSNININELDIIHSIVTFSFWTDAMFWLYFLAFCIKTIVGLIWNYFTRKYILYKNKNK
ncbi:MAG: GtrA family protein [Bacilli bacterium]|nr:GtrA family protein [Bacilli bacterium]